jgi:hypothetical protein
MRVLIQDCDSKNFYSGHGRWSESAASAKTFAGSVSALNYIRANKMGRAQIVLKFSLDEFDVVLPAEGCRGEAVRV